MKVGALLGKEQRGGSYLGLILRSISRHPGKQMSQIHFLYSQAAAGIISKDQRISTFDHAAVHCACDKSGAPVGFVYFHINC